MKYKRDKFEQKAVKIIAIVGFLGFGVIGFTIFLLRFSDSPGEVFSKANVIKVLLFVIVVVFVAIFAAGSEDEDKSNE